MPFRTMTQHCGSIRNMHPPSMGAESPSCAVAMLQGVTATSPPPNRSNRISSMNSPATAYAEDQARGSSSQERSAMSAISERQIAAFAHMVLAASLALFVTIAPVRAAEERSAEQIIDALKPASRVTRSLTTPAEAARSADDARFVEGLRNRTSRSLTADERDKIVAIAKKKPSIDLEI